MKKKILAIALIVMSLVMVVSNANVATATFPCESVTIKPFTAH